MKPIANLKLKIVKSAVGDCAPIPFTTLNQASAAYRAFIQRNDLGGSEAGLCLIMNGSQIAAHVSYNGRVWEGSPYDWKLNVTKCLFPLKEDLCAS